MIMDNNIDENTMLDGTGLRAESKDPPQSCKPSFKVSLKY